MDILHEWRLERYGKQDTQRTNTWTDVDGKNITLKIVAARKMLVSSENEVLECFSLFNCALWLKCFVKGNCLLILHKVKNTTRKFRLRFAAEVGTSEVQVLEKVVQVLRQYMPITNLSQPNSISTANNLDKLSLECTPMETCSVLTGTVPQSELTKAILEPNMLKLPSIYKKCDYPTDSLEVLIRLCLMDPNFPMFVNAVEKTVKKVTES